MEQREDEYRNILKTIAIYVRQQMENDSTGHDWWHIKRVHDLALKINLYENADEFTIRMIALLHDLYDDKFSDKDAKEELIKLLTKLGVIQRIEPNKLENILHSVENLGYKGGFTKTNISKEGKIVQDSDRLDSIGAIGIARVFAYGGKKGIPIYDPEMGIVDVHSEEEYRKGKRHSINHFYEKLLKVKDTMNTEQGRIIAIKRTKILTDFLKEFYEEWGEEIDLTKKENADIEH